MASSRSSTTLLTAAALAERWTALPHHGDGLEGGRQVPPARRLACCGRPGSGVLADPRRHRRRRARRLARRVRYPAVLKPAGEREQGHRRRGERLPSSCPVAPPWVGRASWSRVPRRRQARAGGRVVLLHRERGERGRGEPRGDHGRFPLARRFGSGQLPGILARTSRPGARHGRARHRSARRDRCRHPHEIKLTRRPDADRGKRAPRRPAAVVLETVRT